MDALLDLDRAAALALNGMSGGSFPDAVVGVLTYAGHGVVAFLLSFPVIIWRNKSGRIRALVACISAMAVGGLLVQAAKLAVPRPRPAADGVIEARINDLSGGLRTRSFPSGHAQTAFGAATVVLAESGAAAGAVAFGIALLVGLSRVYLGAHFPSDVLAGAFLGVVIGWLAVYIAGRMGKRGKSNVESSRSE
ncbi:MAG: phosphatase PAP2 family protein [Deltaproteobacteria bacterium]|nr:phosphatase PAP2 family protein [Deltaproteobacteria bacterium]